jgi:HEAT repeat protein
MTESRHAALVLLLACTWSPASAGLSANVLDPGHAATATAGAGAQPVFQQMLADLRSSNERTRAQAVRALSTSGYPDVAPALMPLLADPAERVQLETIDAFLSLGLAPAPDARLATRLKSTGGSIAWSLFDVGPLALLPRTWPPTLMGSLSGLLRDEDARVRVAAAGALAVLGPQVLPTLSTEVRTVLATDVVYGMHHPDAATRQAVARAAGAVFTVPRAATAPVAIGDALIAALNDKEAAVRVEATQALGWVREARAEQALKDRLAFYKSGAEAQAALHALARIAGRTSAELLRQALLSREAPRRVAAFEGLGRTRDRATVPTMTAQAQSDRDETVRLAAAFAFYLLGERGNDDQLVKALGSPTLARQARAYLTELGPDVAPDLHRWLQQLDHPPLRRAVAEVLGLSGHAGSEPILQTVAKSDADPSVAEAARQAALRLRALPDGVRTR